MEKIKEQDSDLKEEVESREEQADPNKDAPSPRSAGQISDDSDNETMIGPDIGLQFLKQREKWQEQEEVNKERPSMHYQDILFDGEFKFFYFYLEWMNIMKHCGDGGDFGGVDIIFIIALICCCVLMTKEI